MSSYGAGPLLKSRIKSRVTKGEWGYASPEIPIIHRSVAAPGAVGTRLWVAECACKLVLGFEAHTTAGSGSSIIYLRKHLAAHTAAPDASTSGSNIVNVASIPADATVNVVQDIEFISDAVATFAEGDKLMLVTPGTLAGLLVQLFYVRL